MLLMTWRSLSIIPYAFQLAAEVQRRQLGEPPDRGLHSSTSQLNLGRF